MWFCFKKNEVPHLVHHPCKGRNDSALGSVETGQALGFMPEWTFSGPSTQLRTRLVDDEDLDEPPYFKHEYIGAMVQLTEVPDGSALTSLAQKVLEQDSGGQYRNWTDPSALKFLLALKLAKHWGTLYNAFRHCEPVKRTCCRILNKQILSAKDTLHVRKMHIYPIEWIEEARNKPWQIRLGRKFVKFRGKDKLLLEVEDCHVIEVAKTGVFGVTQELIEVRKFLNVLPRDRTIQHATVIQWPSCAVVTVQGDLSRQQ